MYTVEMIKEGLSIPTDNGVVTVIKIEQSEFTGNTLVTVELHGREYRDEMSEFLVMINGGF